MTALKDIIEHKKEVLSKVDKRKNIEEFKKKIPFLNLPLDFRGAIKKERINIIAELKKASPSKGVIREDFDAVEIAGIYEQNRASAISVLTEERYFMGSVEILANVRKAVKIPLLRKDFIIADFQVYESRVYGADAVLLIVAALPKSVLKELFELVSFLKMTPLVEIHTEEELNAALDIGANVIGINNRDLNSFKVDTSATIRLSKKIPPGKIIVSESGIESKEDIKKLHECGVSAFLVGEALMRERDIGKKLRELRQG